MPPFRHHPFYCEENAWWNCQRDDLGERVHVALLTGPSGPREGFTIFEQRAGSPLRWDYHAILISHAGDAWQVWDLDSTLPTPTSLAHYLTHSFPETRDDACCARLFSAKEYVEALSTDRRHMRREARWLQPPPPWPPPWQDAKGFTLPSMLRTDTAWFLIEELPRRLKGLA